MTLFYPDVSNNNWSDDWQLTHFLEGLALEGIHGVVHKVSEGDGYQDPYWQTCRRWCENNDTSWLGYHYVTLDNPAAQAANFVSNNGGPNAMLDFEANSGDMNNFWNVVQEFNNAGVNISLAYIPHWYIGDADLSGLPVNQIGLVSSSYPVGPGSAQDIYSWAGGDVGEGWNGYGGVIPTVWQFTDRASIAGKVVDCNAYKGDNLDVLFTS